MSAISEFLSEAQIVVRANTKPFIADFEKAVKQVEATKVTVTVRASMTGFRADLNQKLEKSTKGLLVRPLVRANMKGFKADLLAKLASSTKGVTATVNVRAGALTKGAAAAAAGGGGVATGGVVDKRVAAAQLAVNQATDAGVAARRRITAAISAEEKFATRLAREELHLKAATDAVAKAAIAGVPELLALAEAEERAARAALAASEAQAQRKALGVPVGVSTADFRAAAAEAEALRARETAGIQAQAEARIAAERRIAAEQKNVRRLLVADAKASDAAAAKFVADENKKIAAINAEVAALQKQRALGATLAQLIPAVSNVTRTRDRAGQLIAGGGAAIGADAAARNKEFNEVSRESVQISAELSRARRTEIAAATLASSGERKLAGTRAALRLTTDAALLAQDNYAAALATGIPSLIASAEAEHALAIAQQERLLVTTKEIEREVARTNVLTAGRRAIVAQIANLTGLRGAALTAASGFIAFSATFIALRKAVGIAAELETELSVFKVTAGATAEQMDEVRKKAVALGRDVTLPAVSAGDAAKTLTELSKAGLSVQDSLDGAKGVLQLATAANIDFTQATELAASALNAFGLQGTEASHVADVLANAANESQGSITDAGVALQQSAAVARQAGLSVEQTVAALTLFARAGLRGSDAGTSLRTALIRLINPSAKAEKVIKQLGLRIRDSSGNIDLGVFQQFTDATTKLTAAQRDQALAIVFGQDAIRGAAILAREGSAGLEREEKAINKAGTAAAVAAARTSGYAGAIENLKNQLSTLGEAVGAVLLPSLTLTANALASLIGDVADAVDQFEQLAALAQKPINFVFGIDPNSSKQVKDQLEQAQANAFDLSKPIVARPVDVGGIISRLIVGSPNKKLDDLRTSVSLLGDEWENLNQKVEDATGINFVFGHDTFKQGRQQVQDLVDSINKAKGSPAVFNSVVESLRKLRDEFATGTFEEQQFSKKLDTFITQIQERSAKAFKKPIKVPVTLTTVGAPDLKDSLGPVKEQVKEFVAALNSVGRTQGRTDAVVKGLQKIRKELSGGTKDQQAFAKTLGSFIQQIQAQADSGKKIEIPFDLKPPEDVLAFARDRLIGGIGTVGEEAEKAFWDGFKANLLPDAGDAGDTAGNRFGTLFADAFDAITHRVKHSIDDFAAGAKAAVKQVATAVGTATTQGENQATGFDRRVLDAQLANDTKAEIAARKDAIKSRQREIARIEKEAGVTGPPIPGGRPELAGNALEGVNAAKKDIKAQRDAIDALVAQDAQDAKQHAADIKEKRDAADQAFLDALEVGRTPVERRLARAQAGGVGQVAALVALRKRLQSERDQVADSVKDAKTKTAELRKLDDQLFQNSLDLQAARKQRDEAVLQSLTDRGAALQQLGETTGNTKLILRGLDLQIDGAKQTLAKARQAKTGVEAAQAALAVLRKTRQDTVTQALTDRGTAVQQLGETTGSFKLVLKGLDLQIASAKLVLAKAIQAKSGQEAARAALEQLKKTRRETINEARDSLLQAGFDLAQAKGNKSAMLQILDLQIAQSKKEEKQAKTLVERLVQQAKTAELIQQKKDILNEAIDKTQQGTTVLDLLKQGIETFNASAGNLINANQPFAGPNAFNADIAQFLKFRQKPPSVTGGLGTSGLTTSEALRFGVSPDKAQQKNEALTNSLIAALQELTAATLAASGNTSTAGAAGTPVVKGSPWAGKPWFNWGAQSRSAQES